MVTTRLLDHVGYEFSCDRRPALILLVLSGIREQWYNCGDSFGARNFASMNHDAQLHESRVDRTTSSVDDVHVVLSHRLCYADVGFTNTAAGYFCVGKRQTNAGSRGQLV